MRCCGSLNRYSCSRTGTQLPFPEIAAIKVSIPSDRSFREYDTALEHVFGPKLSNDIDLIWQQAMLDVLFEYPIRSEDSEFSIRPGLERLASRVQTVLRFMPPNGVVRAFQFVGDPGLVRLDPRWHQAALPVRGVRFPPYPGRHRSPAFPPLSGHSVPEVHTRWFRS